MLAKYEKLVFEIKIVFFTATVGLQIASSENVNAEQFRHLIVNNLLNVFIAVKVHAQNCIFDLRKVL